MAGRVLLALLLAVAAARGAEFFNDKVAVLEPFAREVPRGKTLVIEGLAKGAYENPELVLIAPNGKTYLNRDRKVAGAKFTFRVRFDEGPGPYRLEVIAHQRDATRSAARVTVHYAQRAPPEEEEEPPPTGPKTPLTIHERLIEKRFVRFLNTFRKEVGCAPVAWNEAVAARAREHAQRMAEADRRQHRFGRAGGVVEMLERDGAGESGLSGPAEPWGRTNSERPFGRHAPNPPGPRVWNHVVVQLAASESLQEMFETYFVREAAFRICAADPNCIEVAVGAARRAPPGARGRSPLVYYCVCFVQVNEKPVITAQDKFFERLLERARNREPEVLRALGIWGRDRSGSLLRDALEDPDPAVASAAFDALLLLDEEKARAGIAKTDALREQAMKDYRYAEAVALAAPLQYVQYDATIGGAYALTRRDAIFAARREMRTIRRKPAAERATAIEDLRARAADLGLDAEIDKLAE